MAPCHHRFSHLNFAAENGAVQRNPRFLPGRGPGHVDQVYSAAAHGRRQWVPPRFPPRASPAVVPHQGFTPEIRAHNHLTNSAAVDGGVGSRPHFFQPPPQSAIISLDGVLILDNMNHQFPHLINYSTADGGVLRGNPGFQPPHGPGADVLSGGVFVPPLPDFYLLIPLLNSQNMYFNGEQRPTYRRERDGGLPEEVIAKALKTRSCHVAATTDNGEDPKMCIVCQDDLCQENQTIGVLKCGHEYHASCIKMWLQQKNVCPLCKAIAL